MSESNSGTGEKYCVECGTALDAGVGICPDCGAAQDSTINLSAGSDATALRNRAEKNLLVAALLGFLAGPIGYYYVGRTKLAVINLLTLNYLLTGILLVPVHAAWTIKSARDRLDDLGAEYDAS
ncbi:hypothetical protein [Halobellus sp. EA9]|uniref:hypothetical protein n=1 Tax=Halobellus sp. EA9 TaxID=3421647 RepID=UPI003EBE2595